MLVKLGHHTCHLTHIQPFEKNFIIKTLALLWAIFVAEIERHLPHQKVCPPPPTFGKVSPPKKGNNKRISAETFIVYVVLTLKAAQEFVPF